MHDHRCVFVDADPARLPELLKAHLTCRVVDRLEPIFQADGIEGLMTGEA